MTGKKDSPETIRKKSLAQKARFAKWSAEDRKAWSDKMKNRTPDSIKWSDEAKQHFSEIQKTRPNGSQYTLEQVHEIRRLHEEEGKGYTEISKIMDIPRGTVYMIATYRRWANA